MKTISARAVILALVAVTVVGCDQSQAQDPAVAPAVTSDTSLPPGIAPGSQTAEVLKLTQAGLDTSVINAYVSNVPNAFNLDADQIITLKDAGVPSAVINGMMDRDRALAANSTPPPAPIPTQPVPDNSVAPTPDTTVAPSVTDVSQYAPPDNGPDTAPPPPVDIGYFDQTLGGYGTWVMVPGYGRCWRPTTVIYDSTWRPYCDHGHWVYTDCGWYWESDYAWGATFHYGRWFHDSGFGWCWYPDYVWAPSWVVWRSSDDYCGWAPLPPFTVWEPNRGLICRGTVVTVSFDFGFGVDAFVFVDHDHFCDHHPRNFCLDRRHCDDAFHHTTVINHFDVHDRVVVNSGIPPEKVRPHNGRAPDLHPVAVGSMTDARREGWRGPVTVAQHTGPGNPSHTSGQPQHGPAFGGNTGGSHTFNNNGNNNQGVAHFNNPGGNNNNSAPGNSRNSHGPAPITGNSGQHFNPGGQSTMATPSVNNNNPQNGSGNHVGNLNPNGNSALNNNGKNHASNPGQGANHAPNNTFNNQGVTHPNNPVINNNNSQNNRVVSQSPGVGNGFSGHYSSPATTPTAPAVHNSVDNNGSHSGYVSPGYNSGSASVRSQPQYQVPQNSYQTRYNNNNNYSEPERSYSAPRNESAPQASQPQERSSAPAYSSHNSGQSSSGNSGSSSGGQSHSSGNGNGNNNQQGH